VQLIQDVDILGMTKILDKQAGAQEDTKARPSKKKKLAVVTVKELLGAWRRSMVITKEEFEKQFEEIGENDNADTAEESYCISKLLDWQNIMVFANYSTYQVIPYLLRLEKIWLEVAKKNMTFIEYLKAKKITMIDETAVLEWRNIHLFLISDYPMFKYIKVSLSELSKNAKSINAYLKNKDNKNDIDFWSNDDAYKGDSQKKDPLPLFGDMNLTK
jgi:hypothetical protein